MNKKFACLSIYLVGGKIDEFAKLHIKTFYKELKEQYVFSVSSVVEFPGAGLSRLRTINSELNGAT